MASQVEQGPLRLASYARGDEELLAKLRQRREQGMHERRKYEPTWRICESFLAGRQWVGWDRRQRRVIEEPNPQRRERHTVNMITPYVETVFGKLYVEDLRPDVFFAYDDIEAQSIANHTRQLGRYAWDNEVEADKANGYLIHKLLCYGTVAQRCLWDPSKGMPLGQLPVGPDGEPIYDLDKARQFVAQAAMMGQQAEFRDMNEGRIIWEALGPTQFIVPPGIENPADFPWVMVERTMWLQHAKERYPDKAGELREMDLKVMSSARDYELTDVGAPADSGKLREHTVVTTYYELPCKEYPRGRTVEFSDATLLKKKESLPYVLRGLPHHGILFYRYHLVDGRFYGMGVVEPLIGPQRQLNRARSQNIELKDRNLGRVYARKGALTESNLPVGKIMELVEIPLHVDYPQEVAGGGIGPWVQQEAEINHSDMERVSGLHDVQMGRTPEGVEAFSAMALLKEQGDRMIGPKLKELRIGMADAMLLTLELIRYYWQDQKRLAIVGKDQKIEEFIYDKSLLPVEFYVTLSKSAPLPTSPAAEAQKIFDLYHAAIAAGQPLPPEWLADSLAAGRPLPFPKREYQVQQRKAEMEHYFIARGDMVQPDPFDDDQVHLQIHRAWRYEMEHAVRMMSASLQDGAEPDQELALTLQNLVAHETMHVQNQMMKAGGGSTPTLQGGRGIEAQNGASPSMAGAASAAVNGGNPGRPARGVRQGP